VSPGLVKVGGPWASPTRMSTLVKGATDDPLTYCRIIAILSWASAWASGSCWKSGLSSKSTLMSRPVNTASGGLGYSPVSQQLSCPACMPIICVACVLCSANGFRCRYGQPAFASAARQSSISTPTRKTGTTLRRQSLPSTIHVTSSTATRATVRRPFESCCEA
jgi:hypothetical protein